MNLGEKQELTAVKKVEFGMYLAENPEDETRVLLPAKQVPEGLCIGDKVEIFLYRDSKDRLIATTHEPKLVLGQLAVLPVLEVGKIGAFLDWGLGKELFLPYKEQTKEIEEGEKVLVGIYIDKSKRLSATMKVYDYLTCNSTHEPEDIVSGTVYNYNPKYGAFVAVDNKYHGLIQQKELTQKVYIGMPIEARIKSVRPDGKMDLSLRKKAYLQVDDDAKKIVEFMENNGGKIDYTDKASPERIKTDFNMSKSEFKRAIGRLLKEKRLTIGENNIFLNK